MGESQSSKKNDFFRWSMFRNHGFIWEFTVFCASTTLLRGWKHNRAPTVRPSREELIQAARREAREAKAAAKPKAAANCVTVSGIEHLYHDGNGDEGLEATWYPCHRGMDEMPPADVCLWWAWLLRPRLDPSGQNYKPLNVYRQGYKGKLFEYWCLKHSTGDEGRAHPQATDAGLFFCWSFCNIGGKDFGCIFGTCLNHFEGGARAAVQRRHHSQGSTAPLVVLPGAKKIHRMAALTSRGFGHDLLTAQTSAVAALVSIPSGESLSMRDWTAQLDKLLPQKIKKGENAPMESSMDCASGGFKLLGLTASTFPELDSLWYRRFGDHLSPDNSAGRILYPRLERGRLLCMLRTSRSVRSSGVVETAAGTSKAWRFVWRAC